MTRHDGNTTADLQASLKALGEVHRGPHPPPDRLLAYQLDELDAEAREVVEGHIALCSECAREVLDMASFLDDAMEPTSAALREEGETIAETAAREVFGAPAVQDSAPEATPDRPPTLASVHAMPRKPPFYLRPSTAWAAALLLGVVNLGLLGHILAPPDPAGPRPNVELVDLGGGIRGGETLEVRFPDGAPGSVLVVPAPTLPDEVGFAIRIEDLDGGTLWENHELRRNSQGLLTVSIPRGFLPPGAFRLRLARLGDDGEPLADPGAPGLTFDLIVRND